MDSLHAWKSARICGACHFEVQEVQLVATNNDEPTNAFQDLFKHGTCHSQITQYKTTAVQFIIHHDTS